MSTLASRLAAAGDLARLSVILTFHPDLRSVVVQAIEIDQFRHVAAALNADPEPVIAEAMDRARTTFVPFSYWFPVYKDEALRRWSSGA